MSTGLGDAFSFPTGIVELRNKLRFRRVDQGSENFPARADDYGRRNDVDTVVNVDLMIQVKVSLGHSELDSATTDGSLYY
jgi:hypothetical protein